MVSLIFQIHAPQVNAAGEISHAVYCHLCGCEYMVKFNLQKHLLASHTEQERASQPECLVKCDQCSAYFYSQKAYTAHLVHHTPDDLFVQTEGMSCSTRIDADFNPHRVVAKPVKDDCPKSMFASLFGANGAKTAAVAAENKGRKMHHHQAKTLAKIAEETKPVAGSSSKLPAKKTKKSTDLAKTKKVKVVVERLSEEVVRRETRQTSKRRK
jgi:hypothetical protein